MHHLVRTQHMPRDLFQSRIVQQKHQAWLGQRRHELGSLAMQLFESLGSGGHFICGEHLAKPGESLLVKLGLMLSGQFHG